MSGLFGLLLGEHVLISGVEDDPEPGLLRVYVGPRYDWTYVLVRDPEQQRKVRSAFASSMHLTMPKPDGPIYVDEDGKAAARAASEAAFSGSREAPDGR